MGEYATRRDADGQVKTICKVGTMDDWRYVRRPEALALSETDAGLGTSFRVALYDEQTLYRFPWPWEDDPADLTEAINARDMSKTIGINLPEEFARELMPNLDHKTICQHIKAACKGSGENVFFPCPMTEAWVKLGLRASGEFRPVIDIYGERWRDGVPRTIFRCGYCEAPFSCPHDELVKIALAVKSSWYHGGRGGGDDSWVDKLVDRLRDATGAGVDGKQISVT